MTELGTAPRSMRVQMSVSGKHINANMLKGNGTAVRLHPPFTNLTTASSTGCIGPASVSSTGGRHWQQSLHTRR